MANFGDQRVLSIRLCTWELNTGKEKSYEFGISPIRAFE